MNRRPSLLLLLALVLATAVPVPPAAAGEPGRLEDDAEFLLGRWANDCAADTARIILADGALRQQGLLRLGAPDRGARG